MNKTSLKIIVYSLFLIALSSGLTYSILSTKVSPAETVQTEIPKSDCQIRIWYNFQVLAIPKLNEYWITKEIALKERAYKAYNLRHNARIHARFMMLDQKEVAVLQKRDLDKYANPDGPTFEYLLQKNQDKDKSLEQAYESIIQSSSKTNNRHNSVCDK
ncbi:MAG: hypothetical protein ACI976_000632 [Aureispira sp.]|jgi:hypothetical protein